MRMLDLNMVAVITAASVTIIGALVAGITSIIVTLRTTSRQVSEVALVTNNQDKKLDNITLLVDGRYSLVLQELANVKLFLAQRTGSPEDFARAVQAQSVADAQAVRVIEARAAEPHP